MNLTQTPAPLKKFVCKSQESFFGLTILFLQFFKFQMNHKTDLALCKKEAKERQFSRSKGLFLDIKEI